MSEGDEEVAKTRDLSSLAGCPTGVEATAATPTAGWKAASTAEATSTGKPAATSKTTAAAATATGAANAAAATSASANAAGARVRHGGGGYASTALFVLEKGKRRWRKSRTRM